MPSSPDPSPLQHYLYASIATLGGVSATYYTTAAATNGPLLAPVNALASAAAAARRVALIGTNGAAVTTAAAGAAGLWGPTALTAGDVPFVVRWAGL